MAEGAICEKYNVMVALIVISFILCVFHSQHSHNWNERHFKQHWRLEGIFKGGGVFK